MAQRPGYEFLKGLNNVTLLFDPSTDEVILNKDNQNYSVYSMLVNSYLNANEKQRNRFVQETTDFSDEIQILNKAIEYRMMKALDIEAQKELMIINKQILLTSITNKIEAFTRNDDSCGYYKDFSLYFYGYIQGKRDERARRKKANIIKDCTNIQAATLKQIITNRIKGINDLESLQEVYNLLIEKDKRIGV